MKSNGTPFEVSERVRWADVNASGTIYFGAYVRFVESAETEFYRALGFPYRRFQELGVHLAHVHLEFDFYKPALLDDELRLALCVAGVGVHSARLRVAITRASAGTLLAEATLVESCVDAERKSVPLPVSLADALRAAATA